LRVDVTAAKRPSATVRWLVMVALSTSPTTVGVGSMNTPPLRKMG
jgi:hypothetical protein